MALSLDWAHSRCYLKVLPEVLPAVRQEAMSIGYWHGVLSYTVAKRMPVGYGCQAKVQY